MIWNKVTNRKPWKFIGNRKDIFLSNQQMNKYKGNESILIIDVRNKTEYANSKIENSIKLKPYKLRSFILKKNPKSKIIIISKYKRTYMWLIALLKVRKYNKIYLYQELPLKDK